MRRLSLLVTAAAVALVGLVGAPGAEAAGTFNVRDYGATGNGSSNDTSAINNAITAANSAGGGTVVFPSGTYKSNNSIHMKSNVTVQLNSGATIMGSSSNDYDPPEPNPNDDFQDYGHSHFHNAMIWGDRLSNIAFVGEGTIDGGGHLITGNPDSGQADKIISLTRCSGLTVSGITLRRGGHFAMLINQCDNVKSDHLTIDTASDRDGWNVISTTNATITNANIAANDDALVFKSDYALGAKLPNGHVRVSDSKLSAKCCNALMFGSETCGDFTDYQFDRISINGSNKSGLGMVSMDGAKISDVHYRDITVTNVHSPIMQKVGTRKRCGNNPGVGNISNITYDNITITGNTPAFSPTLWGESSGHISNVTFNNVNIRVPGGNGTMSTNPPSNDASDYNPKSIGTRPAYGWYLRYANDIKFINSSVRFAANDGRPAVIANNSGPLSFQDFTVQRGSNSPFDIGFQTTTGVCATNVRDTNGNAVRFNPSTPPSCSPGADFSLAATPSSQSVAAGQSATYTVRATAVSGSPGDVTLSASGQPAGSQVSFSPNPVAPGQDSTMTVTTAANSPNGTATITVTGGAGGVTRTAPVGLTVTGGNDQLAITGLQVADSANSADWSVQSGLNTGAAQYGDRTITLRTVPAALAGAQWIRTANDSKAASNNPLVTFTINRAATVSVAVDTRVGRPSWMGSDWTDTGTSLVNSEGTARTFRVFEKGFAAGQVALGPNGDSGSSMYTIVVR
ncbi:glycosyl hydrolase family 28 protein [Actinocrispum sp. NPDC049592]|uniref:glycosyl hydrolase family 28 protein n=1 Tax=Actinocrispum sp. NPDC049592 TaxID=3154835 RepID=UPI0034388183